MSLNVDMDGILVIDAVNAFNAINRKVVLHNLKFICLIIATPIINCYAAPSRLFIVGERENNSRWPNSYESICIRYSTILA